jgi:hypothetical protein
VGLHSGKSKQELISGFGGVGVGSIIIAITKDFADNSVWKNVFLYAVPMISVVVGMFSISFLEWLSDKLYMGKISSRMKRLNKFVNRVVAENDFPEEQKKKIEKARNSFLEKNVFDAMETLGGESKDKLPKEL